MRTLLDKDCLRIYSGPVVEGPKTDVCCLLSRMKSMKVAAEEAADKIFYHGFCCPFDDNLVSDHLFYYLYDNQIGDCHLFWALL